MLVKVKKITPKEKKKTASFIIRYKSRTSQSLVQLKGFEIKVNMSFYR